MTEPAAVLACLNDVHRRELLEALARAGPLHAGALAPRLGLTRQGVLKHLDTLVAGGLVTRHQVGRRVLFAVQPEPVRAAAAWLDDLARGWDEQLAALKRAAEVSAPTRSPRT